LNELRQLNVEFLNLVNLDRKRGSKPCRDELPGRDVQALSIFRCVSQLVSDEIRTAKDVQIWADVLHCGAVDGGQKLPAVRRGSKKAFGSGYKPSHLVGR